METDSKEGKPQAEGPQVEIIGPWGDWCRCGDCLSGKNGKVTVRLVPQKGNAE